MGQPLPRDFSDYRRDAEADIACSYEDSDAEYWKIDADGTMHIVFREAQICNDCNGPHFVFVMRKDDRARCADCNAARYSLVEQAPV